MDDEKPLPPKIAWDMCETMDRMEKTTSFVAVPLEEEEEEKVHDHRGIRKYLCKERTTGVHGVTATTTSTPSKTETDEEESPSSKGSKKGTKGKQKKNRAVKTTRKLRKKFEKCMEICLHLTCIAYFYFTVENCARFLKRLQFCLKKCCKKKTKSAAGSDQKPAADQQKENKEETVCTEEKIKVLELNNSQQFLSVADIQSEKEASDYERKLTDIVQGWQKSKDPVIWTELLAELEHLLTNSMTERMQVYITVIAENNLQSDSALLTKILDTVHFVVHQSNLEISSLLKAEELISSKLGIDIFSGVMLNKELDALHMAILNKRHNLILHIFSKLEDNGRYSLVNRPAKGTLMKSIGKMTELPLNLAVWGGQIDIIRILVQNGGEMCAQDSQGFNCFHIVSLMAKDRSEKQTCELFNELMKLVPVWIENTRICPTLRHMCDKVQRYLAYRTLFAGNASSKSSPLLLAAASGSIDLLTKILSIKNVYQMTCAKLGVKANTNYIITEVDSLLSGPDNKPSVLEVLAFSQQDHTLQCLSHPLIKALSNAKDKFYNVYIAMAAIIHISIMLIFSGSSYDNVLPYLLINNTLNPDNYTLTQDIHPNRFSIQPIDWFIGFVSVFYFIYATMCLKTVHKIASRCRLSIIDTFWCYNTLQLQTFVLFSICIWFYLFLKMMSDNNDALALSMSMLIGWIHCIAYTRPLKSTGFFTIMINRILFTDIIRFLFVIGIFALAFTMAALVIFSTEHDISSDYNYIYGNPLYIMFDFIRLAAGIADYKHLILQQHFMMSVLIYVTFVIFCNILLFTLLVAAMNSSYAKIAKLDDLHWHRVRLADIITLERIVPMIIKKQLLHHFNYQIIRVKVDKDTQFEFPQYMFEAPAPRCEENLEL